MLEADSNIRYKIGNLLEEQSGVLVHACNTEAKMGSGFALSLAKKYPHAQQAYVQQINGYKRVLLDQYGVAKQAQIDEKVRRDMLGKVSYWEHPDGSFVVANMITQYLTPAFNGAPTSLDAIVRGIKEIDRYVLNATNQALQVVNMPLICAVRGGVSWNITKHILNEYLTSPVSVCVWVLQQEVKDFVERGWIEENLIL